MGRERGHDGQAAAVFGRVRVVRCVCGPPSSTDTRTAPEASRSGRARTGPQAWVTALVTSSEITSSTSSIVGCGSSARSRAQYDQACRVIQAHLRALRQVCELTSSLGGSAHIARAVNWR